MRLSQVLETENLTLRTAASRTRLESQRAATESDDLVGAFEEEVTRLSKAVAAGNRRVHTLEAEASAAAHPPQPAESVGQSLVASNLHAALEEADKRRQAAEGRVRVLVAGQVMTSHPPCGTKPRIDKLPPRFSILTIVFCSLHAVICGCRSGRPQCQSPPGRQPGSGPA